MKEPWDPLRLFAPLFGMIRVLDPFQIKGRACHAGPYLAVYRNRAFVPLGLVVEASGIPEILPCHLLLRSGMCTELGTSRGRHHTCGRKEILTLLVET